jgi:protoporphyrinogen/coproporphyrinogen III oxidase
MIAIVGGGIAGLAAAHELSRRGLRFRLYEASSRLGGLIHTQSVDGFLVDAGADSMLVQKRAGIDLCRELGLESRLIETRSPRTAFVLHDGRLHPLPTRGVLGIPGSWTDLVGYSLLSPAGRMRMALEPLVASRSRPGESIGRFFRRRFGGQVAERIAQPLLGGIYAGDVNDLSLRALAPRLAAAESAGSVLRWAQQRADPGDRSPFRSLRSGLGELVDTIAGNLPARSIEVNAAATALEKGWRLHAGGTVNEHRAVILACPSPVAARLLSSVDPTASRLAAEVRYVSTAVVVLAWTRGAVSHPLNGSGFVVARTKGAPRLNACTWVSSKFEGRAPDGTVLVRAFFGGIHDEAAVDLADDDLIATAVRELTALLSIRGAPILQRVYRWRGAGAQHDVSHPDRVAELDRRLKNHHGLFVTGSGFRAAGVPDCIEDGRRVAAEAAELVGSA